MSDRFHRELAGLATDWVRSKRRNLQQGTPNTVTDSGGSVGSYSFDGQEIDRSELRKVKEIRESGGLVAWLFEAKALMKFGTGAELQSENDDLQEWLDDNFEHVDLTVLDLGTDAIYYPYGLGETVETRGGEFSHIECIEPWTMLPVTDKHGTIQYWEQETQGMASPDIYQPEDIGSIVLNKSSGRDKVGVSEVLRNQDEITAYKENEKAVSKAIEVAGFPHHVWTVGAEGRSPVDDNDLRRVRNLIDNMDGDTQFVVGPDVDHDKITPSDFDFESITKNDLRKLTTAVGLPLEIAGYGREGMGSGSETDLVKSMLALQNEVSRRRFETQFITEFVYPVIDQYSPFNSENESVDMIITPFLDERDDVADLIEKIGDYMSNAEIRDRLDLPALEDEEIADSYRTPKEIEEAEEGDGGGDPLGGAGGFFSHSNKRRRMQIPDNAVSIDSPADAPEGAQVVEGDRGGLYYIPAGEGDADADADSGEPVESIEDLDEGDTVQVDATIDTPGGEVDISDDVIEVTNVTEFGIAIDHPEHGSNTLTPDEIGGIERAEPESDEPEGINEGDDLAPTPDLLTESEMQDANERVFAELGERHGSDPIESTDSTGIPDVETIPDAFEEWTTSGYWDGHAEPIWEALADAGSGEGEIPDRVDGDNEFREGTEEVAEDLVEASQEYAREELFDGEDSITVYRGVKGDLGEQLREAKENGESVEVDPRAMESWSMDEDYADGFGTVMKREITPEDVGLVPALFEPELVEEQEITALDNGSFEIPPEQIE